MKKNSRLERRRQNMSEDVKLFVKQSFDIVDRIHQILKNQGISQKDLAKSLGKTESEISKWMTGTHNFTIKTITKIEAILGESIIETSSSEKYSHVKSISISDLDFLFKTSRKTKKLPYYIEANNIIPVAQSNNMVH
nr:helix-turn-helix transcriptional regulator [uncultured Draconibacterium sp.]